MRKRFLAFFMAVTMCVTIVSEQQVYAVANINEETEESDEQEIDNDVSNKLEAEEQTENDKSGEIVKEDEVKQEVSDDDLSLKNEPEKKPEEQTEQTRQPEGIQKNLYISYLLVDQPYVTVPGDQNIVVGISNLESLDGVSDISLQYYNQRTGERKIVAAKSADHEKILFNLTFSNNEEKGIYSVEKLFYTMNGEGKEIDFASIGIDSKFGVNEKIDSNPDAYVVDKEQQEDYNIVRFGENGEASEESIEDALSNAQNEINAQSRSGENGQLYSAKRNVKVVLDPGHDNTHTGAGANNLREEQLNLKIALYCKKELEEYQGIEVYLTRSSDGSCPYPGTKKEKCNESRVNYAKSIDADVYVSIHLNSGPEAASGAEIYYPNANYNPNIGTEGKALAEKILKNLVDLGLGNRGVKITFSQDGTTYPDGSLADYYGVIRLSKLAGIPAIIVEHAFLTNTGDVNNFLKNESGLQSLGKADAEGIAAYFGLYKSKTIYNDIDYAAVYDYDYYISHYEDMRNAYSNDPKGALEHFVIFGMQEGRQGNAEFNVYSYLCQYSDLRRQNRNDLKQYYLHYMIYGKNEGRKGTGQTKIQNPITVYDGVDYAKVYNHSYYTEKYGDMKKAYQYDDYGALEHFVIFGMQEGRQGNSEFNAYSYLCQYSDLRRQNKNDLKQYYMHFMIYGKNEGRKGTGQTKIQNPITVYDGVDYAKVYNHSYYTEKYGDMKKAYQYDDYGALEHFVIFGMQEGRQGNSEFNAYSYLCQYSDLRRQNRNDLKQYYLHYMIYGKNEGRKGTGQTKIQNPITVYDGVDYARVYDFNYYIENYGDMKKAYQYDDYGALEHFVVFGMQEGRQGNSTFDINKYIQENSYLAGSFGNDLRLWYWYYLGVENEQTNLLIMGNSETNVSQMVAYYNANAQYPTFYGISDAPTIETFCRIYIEEANKEGVKAEVAFCQAMKETGFLRFGGDVKIQQFNFAGLGATGNGNPGESFSSVRIGIRAQIQHLKAYASTAPLNQECVDNRFKFVSRGCAKYVEWLGINENPNKKGWATEKRYGYSIRDNYIKKLFLF